MLYSRFRGSEATRYGLLMEDVARQQYVCYQQQHGHCNLTTEKADLVISPDNPWLAASPDDKVHDPSATPANGLVEYNNPHSAKPLTVTVPEACQQLKNFCLEKTENNTSSNQNTTIITKFNACFTAQIPSGVTLLCAHKKIST